MRTNVYRRQFASQMDRSRQLFGAHTGVRPHPTVGATHTSGQVVYVTIVSPQKDAFCQCGSWRRPEKLGLDELTG